jgi:adenylate cyclase
MAPDRLTSRRKDLPPRVQEAIREQNDRTERLIGWIQLAVICTFATLYTISPKTTMHGTAITGTAIALYFILTVARLVLAYRWRLPTWMLYLSVLFDMALLFGLIWSFHLQYQQPPSFYLKAPTLLYVFIFIALRALRFESQFVLFAGISAATGWLVMVAYVMFSDPTNAMVTRDYVSYLTSNSVLVGAEFDKIVSILVVTAIIAVGLIRGRRLLERAVTEGFATRDLSRFFDPEVAARIRKHGEGLVAGAGEARDAAILNLDVRGFTRLAGQIPPDEVMTVLADYQSRMVPLIQQHRGTIDKFLGDGIMATFGASEPSDTYAADALRALDAAMAAAPEWEAAQAAAGRDWLRINGAVATGRIIFGAVGEASRLEYTVIGDAVNLSAKLEKQNKRLASRACVTAEAYALACVQGYVPTTAEPDTVPASDVGGVDQKIDLVVLAR